MGNQKGLKPNTKKCIRCGAVLPLDMFWSNRPTCSPCARKLWYSPKVSGDKTKSENWPWIKRLWEQGVIGFPEDKKDNE